MWYTGKNKFTGKAEVFYAKNGNTEDFIETNKLVYPFLFGGYKTKEEAIGAAFYQGMVNNTGLYLFWHSKVYNVSHSFSGMVNPQMVQFPDKSFVWLDKTPLQF